MTDRKRAKAGTATRILVTGASVAAGLGVIGLMEAAAGPGATTSGVVEAAPPVTIVRRVVVATTRLMSCCRRPWVDPGLW
jgi:hypothetical protein